MERRGGERAQGGTAGRLQGRPAEQKFDGGTAAGGYRAI
jgi:hypothetical protein